MISTVTLLVSLWVISPTLAHPGHAHRQRAAAPADNEPARTDAEDQAEMERLAVNELPLLLAQLDQGKARLNGETTPDMAQAFEAFVKTSKGRWTFSASGRDDRLAG